MTDESNDVIFVDEPGPKSFKNILAQDQRKIDVKKSTITIITTATTPLLPLLPSIQTDLDDEKDKDKEHKDLIKSKTDGNGATKRTDWDMFAEQDIDSNFDVSDGQKHKI